MRDERDIDRAVRGRKKKTSKRFRSRCKTTTGIKAPLLIPVGASNRDKRPRGPFVLVGATNRDKRGAFGPGWWLQPEQKAPVPRWPG